MEKFTTQEVDGKKSSEKKIEEGRQWKKDMLAKGYQETPDGLLPITEIKKAGYVWKDEQWFIPADEYIADGNSDRQPGEKYIGASRQYLNWRKRREIMSNSEKTVNPAPKLDLREVTPVPEETEGIKIEDIPF